MESQAKDWTGCWRKGKNSSRQNKTNKCSYLSAKVKITNRKKNKHYKSREMKVHVRNNISNKINASLDYITKYIEHLLERYVVLAFSLIHTTQRRCHYYKNSILSAVFFFVF